MIKKRKVEVIGNIGIVELTQGKYSWIDKEDIDKVKDYNWCYCNGYAIRSDYSSGKQKTIWMHRIIMNTPEGMMTDHIETNFTLDNRKSNLRICTNAENMRNRNKRINNTSGFKGVWLNKYNNKWRAQINFNNKGISLGCFDSKEEAALAYNEAAIKYHGEFSRLNIIGEKS